MYSIRKYIPYPVITIMEKNIKKIVFFLKRTEIYIDI